MSRFFVKHIRVSRPSEPVRFEVFLPGDAKVIDSISVISRLHTQVFPGPHGLGIGQLSFRWPLPGDIFLQTRIHHRENHEKDFAPLGLSHPGGAFWNSPSLSISGSRISAIRTEIPASVNRIQGYFKDEFNELLGVSLDYQLYFTFSYR